MAVPASGDPARRHTGESLPAPLRFLSQPDGQRWVRRGLALFLIIGFFSWVHRDGDFRCYLDVGGLVLARQHIYPDVVPAVNTWPPFFSLLCVPLALLARPTVYLARGAWLLLNFAFLLASLRILARTVYGQELIVKADAPNALSPASPELLVPLLLTLRYIMASFEYMQMDVVLFTLVLGGLYLDARGRPAAGGAMLGFAAALKVMPILFVPYLAYRQRWRGAAWAAFSTAAFSLSPILVFGWARYWNYVHAWREVVARGWGAGQGNQSVFAMWHRLIGHGLTPLAAPGAELGTAGDPRAVALTAATALVVAAAALWRFRGSTESMGWKTVSEWSIVFIVSALFGPVCWKHYMVVLLLPNVLLFAVWRSSDVARHTRLAAAIILFTVFTLGALPAPGLLGRALAGRLEMASVITLAGLVMLGGLFWLHGRLRSQPAARLS